MDTVFYIVAGIVAFGILLLVAEPYRFMPEFKKKKKMVGSTYWGIYEGAASEEPAAMRQIEVIPSKTKHKLVVGSATYAAGKGVRMSGHG
jgi:hypothetical protein